MISSLQITFHFLFGFNTAYIYISYNPPPLKRKDIITVTLNFIDIFWGEKFLYIYKIIIATLSFMQLYICILERMIIIKLCYAINIFISIKEKYTTENLKLILKKVHACHEGSNNVNCCLEEKLNIINFPNCKNFWNKIGVGVKMSLWTSAL